MSGSGADGPGRQGTARSGEARQGSAGYATTGHMGETDPNERPTIAEKYGVAIGQGSTRIAARASSGDVVLAAALQRNRLGTALMRLLSEYDSVRADLERAGAIKARNAEHVRELLTRAETFERSAKAADRDCLAVEAAAARRAAARLREEAIAVPKRTPDDIKAARVFILVELKTLTEAKQRVGALALSMASRKKRALDGDLVLKLAGQTLDVFLDPNCHDCDGTGKNGNAYAGSVEKQCRTCRGSGHRRDIVGRGIQEVTFVAVLLGEMQRATAAAGRGMVRALSAEERIGAEADATDELLQLSQRLADLRSEDAEGE